jgi:hypothetical protein
MGDNRGPYVSSAAKGFGAQTRSYSVARDVWNGLFSLVGFYLLPWDYGAIPQIEVDWLRSTLCTVSGNNGNGKYYNKRDGLWHG